MIDSKDTVLSLHRITGLPINVSEPFYSDYPSLKLGVDESVLHYAKLFASLVEQLITTTPNYKDWVLTAPAYNVIPAAANLLCWRVYDLLKSQLPTSITLSVINIRETNRFSEPEDPKTLKKSYDYSKLNWQERIKSRERSSHFIIQEPAFRDRVVIFVNDINVTGTQQQFMQHYFEKVQAATVYWLYVIDIENSIGKSEPQLEHSINYSNFASFEEFAHIIAYANIQYTAKCIWRLFAYSVQELEQLFRTLDPDRKLKILELAVEEGRFNTDNFKEKIALLRAYCAQDSTNQLQHLR
jgi:hypothetical protein